MDEMFMVYDNNMNPIEIHSPGEASVFEMSFYMIISVSYGDKDSLIDLINTATKRFTKEELGELVDLLVGLYEIGYKCSNTECMSIYLNFINEYRKQNNEEEIEL